MATVTSLRKTQRGDVCKLGSIIQSYKANFGVNCIQLEVASSYFMLHINVRVVCDNSRDVYETSFLKAHLGKTLLFNIEVCANRQ